MAERRQMVVNRVADQRDGPPVWRLLRPDTFSLDGAETPLHPRPRSVLIRLLLDANEVVSTSEIADFIWGEQLPKTPSNSVARFVADLRRSLGPWQGRVRTAAGGYLVVVHPGELDVDLARELLEDAAQLAVVDPDRAHAALVRGRDLVGDGPNAALVAFPDATVVLRSHEELRIAILELLVDVDIGREPTWDLVSTLELATNSYPFHERFWSQLMAVLDQAGRKVEALRVGQRARQTLAEAGIEPSLRFRELESAIALDEVDPDAEEGITDAASGRRSNTRGLHGIDEASTTLFGRVHELNELEHAVDRHRVVTIVGLGGSGKTRLALALLQPLESLGTTVYRVGLRGALDAELVVPTVAAVVGVPAGSGSDARSLARAVSHDTFLLLLDNCEHVHSACVELVEALRELAPDVWVLATSREPLGVADEHVFLLGMLALPAPDEVSHHPAAVSLLIDRAEIHLRSREPGDDVLGHLCTITRSLAGHPLAIEMAAAQLAYSSPADLSARIGDLFAGDPFAGDAGDRMVEVLVGIMDWTWEQLDPGTQQLLARLSVFGGGWTLAAAAAVCGEQGSLQTDLDELARRGLVVTTTLQEDERYEMPEPVRSYAAERLKERSEATVFHDRMATWLFDLASRWSMAEQHVWAAPGAALSHESANLVTALGHLRTADRLEELAQLATRVSGMWINHGFAEEVKRWLSPVLACATLSDETRSGAAAMLLAAAHALGELDSLAPIGLRSLELAGGEPHDWVPAVASFLSLWALLNPGVPGAPTSDELHQLSMSASLRSRSSDVNLAVTALYQAHVQFCLRAYDTAAELFADVRSRTREPGRLLLVAELGHGLSLFMAARQDEARASVASWQSRWDTDDWHYMGAIVRAVIVGGCGAAPEATSELAAAVRRMQPATIWGRADEIQTAFGLLAGFRGEHELADQLLAAAATRDVLLAVTTIELVARRRGVTDDEWFAVAEEFWTRVMPEHGGHGAAATVPELVSWWSPEVG